MNRSEPPDPGSRVFKQQIENFNLSIESTPAWFWLNSDENSRMDQIRAGRTFVLAQLQATQMGMVMHPVSQGLQEYPEMGSVYQQLQQKFQKISADPKQTLQMLARIGYLPDNAEKPRPSPRRGLQAHIL